VGVHYFSNPFLLCAIIPIKTYSNAEADKTQILSDNKNKSGIYMWKNIINKKQYIGSAISLSKRFHNYYSKLVIEAKLKKSKSHIYNAILKYGHENFELTILEYCSPEQCIEREDFYLSSENHEYNILEKAGSRLGSNHSGEIRKKISEANKGNNNPNYGKTISNETRQKISDALKGRSKPEGAGSPSQSIEVTDMTLPKNNQTTTYDSIREAARALNINHSRITMYFTKNQQKPYKGIYTFKKI
jgi:group I intron endonuclease